MLKPYYKTELGELYHGDCLEIMKQLKPNSIDLVLTDPPYLIDDQGSSGAFGNDNRKYLKDLRDNKKTFKEGFDNNILDIASILLKRKHFYIFCNKNQLRQLLIIFMILIMIF